MAQLLINLGAAAQDGTGTPLRQGGNKINQNFTEVYKGTVLESDSPANPDSGYALLFPTPDGRVLHKNSDGVSKPIQRHLILYDGVEQSPKLGLNFSDDFDVSDDGDNLLIELKSDAFDAFLPESEFETLVDARINVLRPDEDYLNPTQQEFEDSVQAYLDEEDYYTEDQVVAKIEELKPDEDYLNLTTEQFEEKVGVYINKNDATLKLLIDDRVSSQGYIKEVEVDTKIDNAIPDIEALTTHVDTEIDSLSTALTLVSNDIVILNDFKDNIDTDIDLRISNTILNTVNSLDTRVGNLEYEIDTNLQAKVLTVINQNPQAFRDALNVEEKSI